MKICNRTILITGGSSGIGFALAKHLAMDNKVIICGRDTEKLSKANKELPNLDTLNCDLNNAKDLNNMFSFLTANYPNLDTLISNAGIQRELELNYSQVSDQLIIDEIGTNLLAHIKLTHRLYALLCANNNPVIIFVSSALALVPKYRSPLYSSAKAGLHSYTQSLRYQANKDGLRIIEIMPDVVDTPMTQHRHNESKTAPDDFAKYILEQIENDSTEIFPARIRLLSLINRLFPSLALKIVNRES